MISLVRTEWIFDSLDTEVCTSSVPSTSYLDNTMESRLREDITKLEKGMKEDMAKLGMGMTEDIAKLGKAMKEDMRRMGEQLTKNLEVQSSHQDEKLATSLRVMKLEIENEDLRRVIENLEDKSESPLATRTPNPTQ